MKTGWEMFKSDWNLKSWIEETNTILNLMCVPPSPIGRASRYFCFQITQLIEPKLAYLADTLLKITHLTF